MNTYLITGLMVHPTNDKKWIHQTAAAPTREVAAESCQTNGWLWVHCMVHKLNQETIRKMNPLTCPECGKLAKKYNEPTLSDGGFLDQIMVCSCGWCGVRSVALDDYEIREFKAKIRPKQMRLL